MSKCFNCVHYMGNRHCEAFGDNEIPSVVFYDVLTHNVLVQGDNSVMFEHKNDTTMEG